MFVSGMVSLNANDLRRRILSFTSVLAVPSGICSAELLHDTATVLRGSPQVPCHSTAMVIQLYLSHGELATREVVQRM
ncbi:hypothetical protein CPB85DRAFT_1451840, partial [Mucidula mucida]